MKKLIWAELFAIIVTIVIFGIGFYFQKYKFPFATLADSVCIAAFTSGFITLFFAAIQEDFFAYESSAAFLVSAFAALFIFASFSSAIVRSILFFIVGIFALISFRAVLRLGFKKKNVLISAVLEIFLIWVGFWLVTVII
ncbi:MAG: hypothetical protein PHE59_04410 [Patescibacteria group bacterium]|nr:hypothetical protein [Patescibacteria group bacterium]MDD5164675.1 hypothetical protein [Patescibacteria group bacterium]MDD5535003.1 hypothetical protein [Patescibacteria group bacterium]